MEHLLALKNKADAACRNGRFEDAASLYLRAITLQDEKCIGDVCTLAAVHSNRCLCLLKLNRTTDALKDAKAALSLRPRWSKAHLRLAQCWEKQNSLDQAIANYQRAVQLQPDLEDEIIRIIKSLRVKLARQLCHCVMRPTQAPAKSKQAEKARSRPPAVYHADLEPYSTIIGSKSSRMIAAAYEDGAVRLWCSTSGTLLQTLAAHTQAVTIVSWNQDGALLAVGSLDKTVTVWKRHANESLSQGDLVSNTKSAQIWLRQTARLEGHTGRISAIAFSKRENLTVTASTDLSVRVWDLGAGGQCKHVLSGHSALISDISLDPGQGTLLASASGDAQFKLWDITTAACLQNVAWESGPVVLCGFLPATATASASPLLLTAHAQMARQEGRILLWDVFDKKSGWLDGKLVAPAWAIDGLVGRPTAWDAWSRTDVDIEWAGENESRLLLAVAGADGEVRVWDISDRPVSLFSFEVENEATARAEAIPPWQVAALKQAAGSKNLAKFSPCGNFIAACGAGNLITVRGVDGGEELCTLAGHSGKIRSLEWVGNQWLVSAAEDGAIRKWRIGD